MKGRKTKHWACPCAWCVGPHLGALSLWDTLISHPRHILLSGNSCGASGVLCRAEMSQDLPRGNLYILPSPICTHPWLLGQLQVLGLPCSCSKTMEVDLPAQAAGGVEEAGLGQRVQSAVTHARGWISPQPLLPRCLASTMQKALPLWQMGWADTGRPTGKATPSGSAAFCTNNLDFQTRGKKEQSTTGAAMPTRRGVGRRQKHAGCCG